MASKQLSIIVQAVDRATAPLRSIAAAAIGVGNTGVRAMVAIGRSVGSAMQSLFSLRSLVLSAGAAFAAFRAFDALGEAANTLDEINDASTRLGLSVETLSELRYAANLAGIEFESLASGLATAQKNLGQLAETGGGRARDAVKILGIQISDSSGKLRDMNELLPELLDALASAEGPSREFLAQRIFGESGGRFLQFINEGTNRLREYGREARALRVVFTPEQVKAAAEFRDGVDQVKQAWLGMKVAILDQVGPGLTELLKSIASSIAAVPEIVGNMLDVVRTALSGGPAAEAILREIDVMVQAAVRVAAAAIDAGARVLLVTGVLAMDAAFAVLGPKLEHGLKRMLKGSFHTGYALFFDLSADLFDGMMEQGSIDKLKENAEWWRQARKDMLGPDTYNSANSLKFFDHAAAELNNTALALKETWAGLGDEVGANAGVFLASIDSLLGISAALAKTSLNAADAASNLSNVAVVVKDPFWLGRVQPLEFGQITAGLSDAADDLVREANEVDAAFKRIGVTAAETFSGQLAGAIVDATAGVKSFGDAVKEMFSGLLKQVSQAILQFIILRTVAGVATSSFGSSAGGATMSGGSVTTIGGGVFANKGGLIPELRFAGGGPVPGPNINRDMVPALLTPGEYVLNRRAVSMAGIDFLGGLNRGDVPRGGAPSITISQTIVFQGKQESAPTRREIERATMQGVLAALSQSPSARQQLRSLIA
jgi:hypothetical protein